MTFKKLHEYYEADSTENLISLAMRKPFFDDDLEVPQLLTKHSE